MAVGKEGEKIRERQRKRKRRCNRGGTDNSGSLVSRYGYRDGEQELVVVLPRQQEQPKLEAANARVSMSSVWSVQPMR